MTEKKIENWTKIEKWAKDFWQNLGHKPREIDPKRPPYYILEMFPYPSGASLHLGHMLTYIPADIHDRFKRLCGDNVLRSMGFDSFGLPAEQFAIQTGQHPEKTTADNIANMKKQFTDFSFDYDWTREISTSDPQYYKWTQWIFLQMYDSFFDFTEEWEDNYGNKIKGKAKSVSMLRQYLRDGEWQIILDKGRNKPIPGKPKYPPTEDQIEDAIDNARLAYRGDAEVNWCPALGTVLANEEVTSEGKSERGNHPVEKRKMKQWMMRITDYAERLGEGFERLDWPKATVAMQKNWIGKSEGVEFDFPVDGNKIKPLTVFTTRPDTIFGVTFIAVGEDHELGVDLEGETGKFTGYYARHLINDRLIPIWTADYVLNDYGCGAVMGVPAHDERDFRFAKTHGIEIKPALLPDEEWLGPGGLDEWMAKLDRPFTGFGAIMIRKDEFPGQVIELPGARMIGINTEVFLKQFFTGNFKGARPKVSYKLRDWLFSRQRYWGEPFPIVYDLSGNVYPVDESELPLELPKSIDFKPDVTAKEPKAPLARCTEWVEIEGEAHEGKFFTKKGSSQKFLRETNTMPNWAGSCWYYLRYLDPNNANKIIGKEAEYWSENKHATVDLYIGGSEHAVLHLLYARFWHMFLFDIGIVANPEPFQRLIHQGMVTADAFTDKNNHYVDTKDVEVRYEDKEKVAHHKITGEKLTIVYGKMGKSYKNGVVPEEVISEYGIDVFRMYLMYMGPITQAREWNLDGIVGMQRFYRKIERLSEKIVEHSSKDTIEKLHKTIKNVTEQYENLSYNVVLASLIKFVNEIDSLNKQEYQIYLILLSPILPHLCEFLYNQLNASAKSIFNLEWPEYNLEIIAQQLIKVPVTQNGKLKLVLEVSSNISEEELKLLIKEKILQVSEIRIFWRNNLPVSISI